MFSVECDGWVLSENKGQLFWRLWRVEGWRSDFFKALKDTMFPLIIFYLLLSLSSFPSHHWNPSFSTCLISVLCSFSIHSFSLYLSIPIFIISFLLYSLTALFLFPCSFPSTFSNLFTHTKSHAAFLPHSTLYSVTPHQPKPSYMPTYPAA